jgi:GNAT superfamily N-acetyltransferase
MSLQWVRESPPCWDAAKAAILGQGDAGMFGLDRYREGQLLPGEWWHVEQQGRVVGYGWMDCTWGDAEILLAVDPANAGQGIGTFILEKLEHEAAARGLNYLYNVVPFSHPDRPGVERWLSKRGFEPSRGGDRLMRLVKP